MTGSQLVDLAALLVTSGAAEQLRELARHPSPRQSLGLAARVLVPRWAGGDILVGDTLIDCKTVASVRDREKPRPRAVNRALRTAQSSP